MRSLFCACAIMLMLFNHIEASGMNQQEKKKGRSVSRTGRNAVPLDGESEPQSNLMVKADDNHNLRLFNDETGEFVGGEPSPESIHKWTTSFQPDQKGIQKRFNHDLVRFCGEKAYKPGSSRRCHAVLIEMAHNLDKKLRQNAPLPEIPDSTWVLKKDEDGRERLVHIKTGRFADESLNEQHPTLGLNMKKKLREYQRKHGLLSEVPLPGGHQADLQHELEHNPFVSTPSLRRASAARFNLDSSNPGHHNLWNQADHNQHASTLHTEQPYLEAKFEQKASVPNDASNSLTDKPSSGRPRHSVTGRFVPQNKGYKVKIFPSRQPHHALSPEISNGEAVNIASKVNQQLDVHTPHLGQASIVGNDPYLFNHEQHELWNQPEYPYANAQNLGQESVAWNDQYHFNPEHGILHIHPNAGLPPNILFSEQPGPPHDPGSHGYYGGDHQQKGVYEDTNAGHQPYQGSHGYNGYGYQR